MIGGEDWIKVRKAVVRAANGGKIYEFEDCETTSDDISTTFHCLDKNGEDIYSMLINSNIESIILYGVSTADTEVVEENEDEKT